MPEPIDIQDLGLCEHLQPIEKLLRELGVRFVWVGQPWSKNCHRWAQVEDRIVLNTDAIEQRLNLAPSIVVHTHRGTHDGSEHGFVCNQCNDAIMGGHPDTTSIAKLVPSA